VPDAPTVPYGEWPSPISASDVARSGVSIGFVSSCGEEIWWGETRPTEDGRSTVVRRRADGTVEDVLPQPWRARTRVHEYGGRAWLPVPGLGDDDASLVFANWEDQRLYILDAGSPAPRPLTPAPEEPGCLRYADPVLSADAREVMCVREAHLDGRVTRRIVAVPLDGSASEDATWVREVAGGSDFLACPRMSPDGRHLAWIAWDHPRMPWDGSELRVADLEVGVASGTRTLMGGAEEAVLQPEWADDGTLYAVSDRTGWWNLYRVALNELGDDPPEPEALCPREEEFGTPMWVLGFTTYAVLPDGRLAVVHGTGTYGLSVLDPSSGTLTAVDTPFTVWTPTVTLHGDRVLAVAGNAHEPLTAVVIDVESGKVDRLRPSLDQVPDAAYLPEPRSVALPGPDGRVVHAHVFPPRNPDAAAPPDERPPYLVNVHGGPTAQSLPLLDLEIAYFTSRGIGVVDVNYGGSSGYGRAYRLLLEHQWGVVDVEDAVAAAQALIDSSDADGARIAIKGESAGGWTTLAALTRTDFFAAGVSYFGVAELLRFAEETHDFESRYLDTLIGPLPEAHDLYVERAPLSHVDEVSCPVLLLQGSEDQVVPPSQSLMFRDALARKGIPHAYIEFEGEQHGFRKESSIIESHEAELSFYGQVFGFEPPDVPRLELSTG
jgi:dipeptidyl aminopeptidase/acylaminoacyl peptidase